MNDPRENREHVEPAAEKVNEIDAGLAEVEVEKGRRRRSFKLWFWVTIGVLLLITVSLHLLAVWHSGTGMTVPAEKGNAVDQIEAGSVLVERSLRQAESKTEDVGGRIGLLLEEAYAPVFAGIPAYMDFHYSLKGEWLELSSAALGEMGAGLDRFLFAGLQTRLSGIADELEQDYIDRYVTALDEAMTELPGGAGAQGDVVARAIEGARDRITMTGGTFAATATGALSAKILAKGFAQKLGVKLAAKVAVKTGTKWVTTAGGAGAAAAACFWTGPGAAGCAIVGAMITWVGVDLAMIKLDEYITRDDFERDLSELIEGQKDEARQSLEGMLQSMERATGKHRKIAVRDVALSELRDHDRMTACRAATDIMTLYDAIRANLAARSPGNIAALRQDLNASADSHLLAPWIDGLLAALADRDLRPWVDENVSMVVELPRDLQVGRELRATLVIGETRLEFDWTAGSATGRFDMTSSRHEKTLLESPQRIELELVQDRGMFRSNRSFTGSANLDIHGSGPEGSGLTPEVQIPISMHSDVAEGKSPVARLGVPLAGVPLPEREMPEFCAD